MELDDKTLRVLQSFARINPNILIEEGNRLRTIAYEDNVFAKAVLDVEFPKKVGIYDLNDFLSVLTLVEDPQLDFKDKYVAVKSGSGRSNVKYFYTDPDMLKTTTMEGKVPPTDVEITFTLDRTTLQKVLKAANTLGHEDVVVTPSGKSLELKVYDPDQKTANTFAIDIAGDFPDEKFELLFNVANLKKLIPEDYKVIIYPRKSISRFDCDGDIDLVYFVALEEKSKYGE